MSDKITPFIVAGLLKLANLFLLAACLFGPGLILYKETMHSSGDIWPYVGWLPVIFSILAASIYGFFSEEKKLSLQKLALVFSFVVISYVITIISVSWYY